MNGYIPTAFPFQRFGFLNGAGSVLDMYGNDDFCDDIGSMYVGFDADVKALKEDWQNSERFVFAALPHHDVKVLIK